jgi:hypothetical protein
MRKTVIAALAALSFGALVPAAQAAPLNGAGALRPAADGLGDISTVRYCEYFDPTIGDWVSFYVPGPCLRAGMPGFDIWLGRYYRGHRHWRGRVGARPWLGGGHHGGPRVGTPRASGPRMGAPGRSSARPGGGGGRTGARTGRSHHH